MKEGQTDSLWFVTARTCNLACPYCYQGADRHDAGFVRSKGLTAIMPKSVADRALPWALQWTGGGDPKNPGHLGVQFYGGEPLLAWPLIRAVVPEWREAFAATGKGLTFGITTNGTRLTPEVREFFDREDVGILLSLDGPRDAHNAARPSKGGGPSWDQIRPLELLAWRPHLEIAWSLAPGGLWSRSGLEELAGHGFRRINFNLDFLQDWPLAEQDRLRDFAKLVGRMCARGALQSNWWGKYERAGTVDQKMERPCGLATRMLALTPEGDLFPSQEMAFTVYEPGRAPGTPDHYRVGNVARTPVLDPVAKVRVGLLKTSDMRPRPGFNCEDCVAKSACIGGCHCRYVGGDGLDPAQRMDIPAGHCQSMRAFMTGMMMGAWIERRLRPENYYADKSAARFDPHSAAVRPAAAEGPKFPDAVRLTFGGEK